MTEGSLAPSVMVKGLLGEEERFTPLQMFVVQLGHLRTNNIKTFQVTVPRGLVLSLQTANTTCDDDVILYIRQGKHSVPCCVFRGNTQNVTGMNLEFSGPQTFELRSTDSCNVLGNIHHDAASSSSDTNHGVTSLKRKADTQETAKEEEEEVVQVSQDEVDVPEKPKMSTLEGKAETASVPSPPPPPPPPQRLNKKQRRAQAKAKAKELEKTVAELNGHVDRKTGAVTIPTSTSSSSSKSLYKERTLQSGVAVQDIVIGAGQLVKMGRKVSIKYKGAFVDGKVFDSNQNRKSPLQFRQGTGQVVKGLEKGLEGMKVGGERTIKIPPELGYGKKGSGNVIPPNSTLIFTVKLVAVG